MPFYKWTGIDLFGNMHYGEHFAKSFYELTNLLLSKEIGLVHAYDYKIYWLFKRVDVKTKANFIQNLAILLESKVRLYNALQININTIRHRYFKIIIEDIALAVSNGKSLDQAFEAHNTIFDPITIALVSVCTQTGNLDKILQIRSEQMIMLENFRKKVSSSLMTPIITAFAFILLLIVIFLTVIPKFKNFFFSFKDPLPSSTQFIFSLSDWMQSYNAFLTLILFFCVIILLAITWHWKFFFKIRSKLKWQLPFIKSFYAKYYTSYFLQLLSILLIGNIQLPKALSIINTTIKDEVVKSEIEKIMLEVISGKSLSLSLNKSKLFYNLELQAFIEVGESSNLPKMVSKASQIYQDRLYELIHKLSVLISPLILILLGLSIGALIFAIYLPLLTLSNVIS